ncbi:hypothetical protein [Amnibacterium sp.]|uniref:hypothetical protein n=1 Tax=Amnibacterium sp. TaxID=1872496 RepID=UPI003F7C6E8F
MSSRALRLLATLAAVGALVTGCSSRPAVRSTSQEPAATPTITPLVTPTVAADEVVRSVLSGGTVREGTGAMPRSGALAVDVGCWGADGSTMTWRLVSGDGAALGLSGTADCSGPPTTSWLGITSATRPPQVRVVLHPGSGVVSAYAIVRRGTP